MVIVFSKLFAPASQLFENQKFQAILKTESIIRFWTLTRIWKSSKLSLTMIVLMKSSSEVWNYWIILRLLIPLIAKYGFDDFSINFFTSYLLGREQEVMTCTDETRLLRLIALQTFPGSPWLPLLCHLFRCDILVLITC